MIKGKKMSRNIKIYGLLPILSSILLSSSVASANSADYVWGGVVGGLVGSTLTQAVYQDSYRHETRRPQRIRYAVRRRYPPRYRYDERYRCEHARPTDRYRKVHRKRRVSRKKSTKHHYKSKVSHGHKKKHSTPAAVIKRPIQKGLSDAQKVQKGLWGLGFYQGALDGELNSYQTHAALRALYSSYEVEGNEVLEQGMKKQLMTLGELFLFDHALIAKSHTAEAQIKQLQTALKIHGYYHDAVDGIMGPQTRDAIIAYKKANMLDKTQYLDLESKYHLVKQAKRKNEKMIDLLIGKIKQKEKPFVDKDLLLHSER